MVDHKKIANFLYEAGNLKRVKRSGWWTINIKDPETVAEHIFRTAVVGYFLAKLEKVDAGKVALMCLFHDMHETRINDLHKVGHRYIDFREAEKKVSKEQAGSLGEFGGDLFAMHKEFQEQKTKEAIVARDADLLENLAQAREYIKIGYHDAQDWINNINKHLRTPSAKRLAKELEHTDPNEWWHGLKNTFR